MKELSIVQTQPRQHALDQAAFMAPTRQREVDHKEQGYIFPERAGSCSGNRRSVGGVNYSNALLLTHGAFCLAVEHELEWEPLLWHNSLY